MKNYDPWNIPILEGDVGVEELLEHLVGWGILAPSTHNTQPWKFRIIPSKGVIDLCLDGRFVLPESDKRGRQSVVSIGCALQNVVSAAESYHLSYSFDFLPGMPLYPAPIVSFRLEDVRGSYVLHGDRELLNVMKARSMNRNEYDSTKPIPSAIIDRITGMIQDMGLELQVITDMPTILAISDFQYMADSTVVMRTRFRNELSKFFLVNDSLEGRGMPGMTFGLDDMTASSIKQELGKVGPVNPGKMAGFARSSRNGIRSSPAVFVVSAPEDTPRSWLTVGMAFEKAALSAQSNGLSVAVHAGIIEVGLANQMLRLRLKGKGRPTMLFRMGYAKETMPHAPRLSVNEVGEIIAEEGELP